MQEEADKGRSPHPSRPMAVLPYPFWPSAISPGQGESAFPFRGRLSGGRKGRPYGGSGNSPVFFVGAGHWPARRCTRRVQEAAPYSPAPAATCSARPGAVVEAQQRQFLNSQGPVARREFRTSLRFCAPEMRYHKTGERPSEKGAGESGPMDLGGAKRSPSPSAASPGAFCPIPRCSRRSPAKRVRREGEEQGNERSFRRQAETEWSGLCDDEPPWAK